VRPEPAFRAELRSFFEANHPGRPPRDPAERLAFTRAWAATLQDAGYAGPAWPEAFGGMDLPVAEQLVYHEEVARARVPAHPSPHAFMVGPTIYRHGSDAQRRQFLLATLRAEILWCQGFSEPDAGSDLASLRTRAVRSGDHYVVSGQKVWTSRAESSDWMFLLVRTGTVASRQDGISYLLMDMRSPGISVRPLRDLTGGHRFTHVMLDEVPVPVANRVGEENGGWAIARTTLGHERSTSRVAAVMRYRRVVRELIALAAERGVSDDPAVRQELARMVVGAELLVTTAQRIVAGVLADADPGPASSIFRLAHALFEKELHEVAMRVIGLPGVLAASDPLAVERGRWTWGFLSTRAATIGAGTAEVQRNTIAERILGLPREP
jgi:alkylation response protein AidB-like acyl-CoA dehydrogenase